MRVVTYNIRFGWGLDGEVDLARIAESLRGADIIALQEVERFWRRSGMTDQPAELAKLARVAAREVPGAPHDVLLVIDATTGQNGLTQAEEFTSATELTGVVLTKLDGTAKGGVALGIHRRLGVPIRYVGVGEGVDDLLEFDPGDYVDGLLGETRAS